jgi:predicted transcriptional regulator YheO
VDDVGKVISEVIQEEELAIGRRIDHLNRRDRLDLLLALDRRGVFSLQRAVPQVAEHLGVSRATLYADLRETRGDAAGEGEARTTRRGERDGRG